MKKALICLACLIPIIAGGWGLFGLSTSPSDGFVYLHQDSWNGSADAEDNWSSTQGTDADIYISASGGPDGSDCMEYTDDNANTAYVQQELGSDYNEVWGGWVMRESDIGMGPSNWERVLKLATGAGGVEIEVRYQPDVAASPDSRQTWYYDAYAANSSASYTYSSGWTTTKFHYVEHASAGSFTVWVDGVQKINQTGLANDNGGIGQVRLGGQGNTFTNAASEIRFDDWLIAESDPDA